MCGGTSTFVHVLLLLLSSAHQSESSRINTKGTEGTLKDGRTKLTSKEESDNSDSAMACTFPYALRRQFQNIRMVGAGANGCVYLTEPLGGGPEVAVKIPKKKNMFQEFEDECANTQQAHKEALKKGVEALALVWQYLPACIEVGGDDQVYMIMQSAKGRGFFSWVDLDMSVTQRMELFSQVVAAVYSLHGIGYAHNDMFEGNMHLNPETREIALIDFDTMTTLEDANWGTDAWRRDSNNIWRFAGQLSGCEGADYFDKHLKATTAVKTALLGCVRSKIRPDEGFMTALGNLMQLEIDQNREMGVEALYNSLFVQGHLPELRPAYYNCAEALDDNVDYPAAHVKQCILQSKEKVDCTFDGDVNPQTCEAHGCCWHPSAKSGDPWCYKKGTASPLLNPPRVPPHCDIFEDERDDCPARGEGDCGAKGCCWVPSEVVGVPWCFKAKAPS